MSARVGLIIPSSNRMVEQEMVHAFPDGVTPHITRLRMTGPNRMGHDQLIPRVEEATRSLADAKCDVVAFHCTANSMEEGQGGEARILAAVAGAGARHATTTATAIRRALDVLGARKIVLVTPYSQAVTDHEAEFLNDAGYDVIYAKGYELAGSDAYCATPPEVVARSRAGGGASGRRRLFPELRQYFGVQHHRGSGSATRPSGHHQQPDRGLGRAHAARMGRPPRLPGTIVRSRCRCGVGAGGATCVGEAIGEWNDEDRYRRAGNGHDRCRAGHRAG